MRFVDMNVMNDNRPQFGSLKAGSLKALTPQIGGLAYTY